MMNKFFRFLFWVPILLVLGLQQGIAAEREYILAEVNPKTTQFNAYLSYKYKLLLISLVNKKSEAFSCQPNRYLIYNYGKDNLQEINAGNLSINSDFSKVFFSKVHLLPSYIDSKKKTWVKDVQSLLMKFNISSRTLEKAKLKSTKTGASCWSQAAVFDFAKQEEKSFPYLVANLCTQIWCSDHYWSSLQDIQFWAQMTPQSFHLIKVNSDTGAISILKKQALRRSLSLSQENAPRKNLVDKESLKGKNYRISSASKNQISFDWKQQENGNIIVKLIRNGENAQSAQREGKRAGRFLHEKKYTESLRAVQFGEWLDPDSFSLRLLKIKILSSLQMFDELFSTIEKSSSKNKEKYCQTLHTDDYFRELWKRPEANQKFKKVCFQKNL